MKAPILVLIPLLFVSCRQANSPRAQVLSDDSFRSVYIALLEKSGQYKAAPGDTTRLFDPDSIFHAFNTSESEFRLTVESYKGNPKKWQEFYDGVVKSLEDKQKQRAEKAAQEQKQREAPHPGPRPDPIRRIPPLPTTDQGG